MINTKSISHDPFEKTIIFNYLQSVLTDYDYVAILDKNFRYRYINKAYKTYFHLEEKDVFGKTQGDIFGKLLFEKTIYPHLEKTLKGETTNYASFYRRGKIKRYILVNCYPYCPFGQIEGILLNGRDITELKKMSDKYKIQKAYFENLFQNSPDAIAIVDNDDRIININKAFTLLFGFTLEECKGNFANDLIVPHILKKEGLDLTKKVTNGQHIALETVRKTKTGKEIDVSIIASPIVLNKNQLAAYVIYRDITERRIVEKQRLQELKEKEALVKEIHHRVKNNMQIISSLLNMQTQYIDNEKYKNTFNESKNRIQSMAFIHELVYQSDDLSHINFMKYLQKIISNIPASYINSPLNIHYEFDIQKVAIPFYQAVPLGLLVNEILLDVHKHAFKNTENPIITFSFHKKGTTYELTIKDNRDRMNLTEINKSPHSLGMYLIQTLTKQLHGTLEMTYENGLQYTLRWDVSNP